VRVVLFAICAVAAAQPHFESASVKRMGCGEIHNSPGPGTVVLRGDPLSIVLMEAFTVKRYQIVGPAWLDQDCFEIVAKMPEGAAANEMPAMLQALLAERFHLAAHKENRPGPVYALVVDKGGPKFQEASQNYRRGTRQDLMYFRAAWSETQGFKGVMTMSKLAGFLAGHLDRPVQDLTGLSGTYDIDLLWARDPAIDPPARFPPPPGTQPDLPDPPKATLFTAIRESLGLKLEARTVPTEMLVIDRIERVPIEN